MGFFDKLKKINIFANFGSELTDDFYDELEESLILADTGMDTTLELVEELRRRVKEEHIKTVEEARACMCRCIADAMTVGDAGLDLSTRPSVVLFIGVNGVGKTTTIAKLAHRARMQGKKVMIAAADTFRAAAVEQLQVWGQRNNIPVIAQHTGADSASVIFDAIQAAKARHVDVLIADTAGRLQNKSHLMEELKKIVRVMKKLDVDAPHEVMLTIDASTGQNAISQAKLFHEAVGLTGITLTKLDGTAKGGVIFSVADQFGIPIRYIGVGERIEDLRPFNAGDFIEALFARED